jgi:hypothetical protein
MDTRDVKGAFCNSFHARSQAIFFSFAFAMHKYRWLTLSIAPSYFSTFVNTLGIMLNTKTIFVTPPTRSQGN